MFIDYYAALSLHPSCSANDVRKAFKRLALIYHPDRADEGNADYFREIKEAYDVLSDPARRYLYDLGYAEMVWMRQRFLGEEQRMRGMEVADKTVQTQITQTPLSPEAVSGALPIHTNNMNRTCLSEPNSFGVTPAGSRREPRNRETSEKLRDTAAAQAVTKQGSALMAVRGLRGAEQQQQQRVDAGVRAKNALFSGRQEANEFFMFDVKFSPLTTSLGSRMSGDSVRGCQGEGRRRQQQGRPQELFSRGCSGAQSVFLPKATVPQWGIGKLPSRREQNVPAAKMLCTSIIKTWRAFFHVPEIAREQQ